MFQENFSLTRRQEDFVDDKDGELDKETIIDQSLVNVTIKEHSGRISEDAANAWSAVELAISAGMWDEVKKVRDYQSYFEKGSSFSAEEAADIIEKSDPIIVAEFNQKVVVFNKALKKFIETKDQVGAIKMIKESLGYIWPPEPKRSIEKKKKESNVVDINNYRNKKNKEL